MKPIGERGKPSGRCGNRPYGWPVLSTMTRSRALLCLAAALLASTAGCVKNTASGDHGSGSAYAADDVVVQVRYIGGFITPVMVASRLPIVTVYGDGRVLTEGPQVAIYPAPALPNVQVQQISAADVAKLAGMAQAAGVGTAKDLGQPPVADAPSTRFTVRTPTGLQKTEVEALQEASGSGLTEEQQAARKKLRDFVTALGDLEGTLGKGAVGESKPYAPTAVAAVTAGYTADPQLPQKEIAWPGPALPGEPFNGNTVLHCATVDGRALAAVLKEAEHANALTPWTYGGKRYQVTFRPLLPDEQSCSALALNR